MTHSIGSVVNAYMLLSLLGNALTATPYMNESNPKCRVIDSTSEMRSKPHSAARTSGTMIGGRTRNGSIFIAPQCSDLSMISPSPCWTFFCEGPGWTILFQSETDRVPALYAHDVECYTP